VPHRSSVRLVTATVILSVAGTLGTAVAAAAPAAAASTSCVPPPVAHRGDAAQAPENTVPAFRRALALGVRRLELDVRFTNGDVPVIMHDPTVDRTTDGTGEVSALALSQLRALDAGSWFSSAFRGTPVPTLYEALSLVRSKHATVMVELKTLPTASQMQQFVDRIRWLSMESEVIVTSFDGPTIAAVRSAATDLRTAIIDNPRYRQPSSVLQYGRTYVVNQESVTESRAAAWRRAGISFRPWTVDSTKGWARMAHDKASAVITDRPARYLAWARARCR
jgi:glycerophosphoryl diester phosphodiesterase